MQQCGSHPYALANTQLASVRKLELPHCGLQEVEQYEDSADLGEPELVHEYDDHAVADFQHAFHVRQPPIGSLPSFLKMLLPKKLAVGMRTSVELLSLTWKACGRPHTCGALLCSLIANTTNHMASPPPLQPESAARRGQSRDPQSELDPRMTLHVGLAPPKRGQQPTPEEFLDAMQAELMEGMQLDEEEWEEHVAGALEGFDDARAALVAPPIPVGLPRLILASCRVSVCHMCWVYAGHATMRRLCSCRSTRSTLTITVRGVCLWLFTLLLVLSSALGIGSCRST